ncbi:MAG: ATP synthase F0 subunit B [Bdellovibrionales bacterium]|jgi:F-type H+-transporting ATPase subunit b
MKRIDVPVAALWGLLVWASPAIAEEQGSKTLPQLDVALYPGVLFWMVSSFLVLFVLMTVFGIPGIRKTIDKRKRLLTIDLEAARLVSEQAAEVVRAYEEDIHDARRKAQDTVSAIVVAASHEAAAQSDQLEQELRHRMIVAQENIAQAKQEALKETQEHINDLVHLVVTKLMEAGISPSPDKGRA